MTAHRTRAKEELDSIAAQVKQAMADAAIDIELFFLLSTGDALITYGTPSDFPDEEWNRVTEIVEGIVRKVAGLDRLRSREIMCATTADHLPTQNITSTAGDRFQLSASHPVLAEVLIDPVNWDRLQQMADENLD